MSGVRTWNITRVEQRRRPLHYRSQLKIHCSKNVFKVAKQSKIEVLVTRCSNGSEKALTWRRRSRLKSRT